MSYYGTREARHWTISSDYSPRLISLQPTYLRSILILFSYLRLGLLNSFFPECFQSKLSTHFLIAHACFMPLPFLTNSMEQSPSSETNSHSDSQEITRLLWDPKLHYRVHKSPSYHSWFNHLNTVILRGVCWSQVPLNSLFPFSCYYHVKRAP
jgi:hypothetical protein